MSKRQIIALNNIVLLVIEVASASACVSIMSFVTTAMASSEMSQNGKHLRRLSDNNSVHKFRGNGPFADGTETFYYDFSLAWRFLGFYTDCNVCIGDDDDDNDDNNNDNNNNGGEEYFVAPSECLENGEDRTVCRRYAMWAAYVDEAYEGKGPSEYQHFDHRTKRWDRSACSRNGGRCAKLDCHNPSSQNFELVGVFKDPQTDAFINSMIDYQGDCVWNDDEYKFMKAMTSNNNDNNEENNNSWFPTKCTAYEIDGEHDRIYSGYYDALPTSKGNMGVALYTDSSCTMPYQGKDHSAQEVMARSLGSSSSALEEKFDSWNEAMDAFKICQPCVAYKTLSNDSKTPYNADGDRYEQENGNSEEEQGNENENAFVCGNNLERDEPVNQCKVFAEQGSGSMMVATYRDILRTYNRRTAAADFRIGALPFFHPLFFLRLCSNGTELTSAPAFLFQFTARQSRNPKERLRALICRPPVVIAAVKW
uniref:Uncharacterized protein n=1 Tax=Pseudo-nitzschia australis TaxID=44445 RepID=A0A7S4AQU1_9STRA